MSKQRLVERLQEGRILKGRNLSDPVAFYSWLAHTIMIIENYHPTNKYGKKFIQFYRQKNEDDIYCQFKCMDLFLHCLKKMIQTI